MHRILVILPNECDREESTKLDPSKYEIHLLYTIDDAKEVTTDTYGAYMAQPGFLVSYVDKAVEYVKKNNITAVMFCHDLASIVASVVCERTGLRGPTLESTFCSLHKYYSRRTEQCQLWYDYIHLDDPDKKWKDKIRYPCFLKAPCLVNCMGSSCIRSEEQMEVALEELSKLVAPYIQGYSEFFAKYLDLSKYPLAVENIAIVEELVETGDQYCIEGWIDEGGEFHAYSSEHEIFNSKRRETPFSYVVPTFSLSKNELERLVQMTEEVGKKFGLRNTFFDIEVWKHRDDFTLIEVNSRITYTMSPLYTETWGVSVYRAAVYLACGEIDKVKMESLPSLMYTEGEKICGQFLIYTYGEGRGKDFVNFDYIYHKSAVDGAFRYGGPGMRFFVKEDSPVKPVSSSGFLLCDFYLSDCSSKRLLKRAKGIVSSVLVRPQESLLDGLPF